MTEANTKPPGGVHFKRDLKLYSKIIIHRTGTSLVAQWIRLRARNAGGPGSSPGQGTRSHMHVAAKGLHATTKEPWSHN